MALSLRVGDVGTVCVLLSLVNGLAVPFTTSAIRLSNTSVFAVTLQRQNSGYAIRPLDKPYNSKAFTRA